QQNVEAKIRNIELLNELGLKRSKGVQLRVNAADITEEMIGAIEDVCNAFSGGTPLFLKVMDDKENITLELLSRKFRVSPVNDMAVQMKKAGPLEIAIV